MKAWASEEMCLIEGSLADWRAAGPSPGNGFPSSLPPLPCLRLPLPTPPVELRCEIDHGDSPGIIQSAVSAEAAIRFEKQLRP
jgi:hypothetical protein